MARLRRAALGFDHPQLFMRNGGIMPGLKNRDTATVVDLTEQQETGAEDRPEEQAGAEAYVPDRKGSNKPLFSDDSDAFENTEMGTVRN